jgi:hypothetical protein
MGYKIMVKNKDGSTETLESGIDAKDIQARKRHWQNQVKPRFVYIKKEGWFG